MRLLEVPIVFTAIATRNTFAFLPSHSHSSQVSKLYHKNNRSQTADRTLLEDTASSLLFQRNILLRESSTCENLERNNNNTPATMNGTTNGTSHGAMNSIEEQRAKAGFVFREDCAPGLTMEMKLNNIYHTTESDFQSIEVIHTYFGKTLVTDGKTQSTQFDEFAYHESLVHPALLQFAETNGKGPKKVLIGGGGELATAREVLKYTSVEKCVMVDLDEKVVQVSLEHLEEWGGREVTKDPRFELIVGDAYAWILACQEKFDCIIMDISDPIEAGPGIMLYTKELYEHLTTVLSENGVFVTQAGTADSVPMPHATGGERDTSCFGPIQNTLQEVFSCVLPYTQNIPSFGGDWGFVMAFQAASDESGEDWKKVAPETIDELIEQYIQGGESSFKMYDGVTHHRMFHLTKAVRKQLAADNRIMTKDQPVFMF